VQGFLNRIQLSTQSGSAVATGHPEAEPEKNSFSGAFSSAFSNTIHGTFDGAAPYVEQMKALKREFDALDIRNPSLRSTL